MPTDITKAVSTLGIISESLGIGDSTPVDKGADIHIETEADPCLTEKTSKEGRNAAATGDAIRADLESRRKGIL